MTERMDNKLPVMTEDETTVGNYFVANYPPFSFWSPDHAHQAHSALQSAPDPGTDLGLYVHIPYCRKRCHFCYFRVYTDRNAAQIGQYMSAVISEMALYAQQPFIAGRTPRFVYFGGGTPSYLSPAQLRTLTDGLKSELSWDAAEEIAFECEPGTLNRKKLQAIRDLGVTRLSLGVENFDDSILEVNNRAHLSRQVFTAYGDARAVGFGQINIDLIAGMVGETDENWQRCVEKTIELAPDSVTIYQMEIPYNTTIFKQMEAGGRVTAPVADWKTKRRWVAEAFRHLESSGYGIGSAYTAVRDPSNSKFLYRDALWTGADMIGLGVASFSQVGGTHFQNQHNSDPYEAQLADGRLPIYRALKMTDTERLVRQLVLQMKLGRVRRAYFLQRFDVDVYDAFAGQLADLENAGDLTRDEQTITLSRDALLRVDSLLHAFFLPEHRDARYA